MRISSILKRNFQPLVAWRGIIRAAFIGILMPVATGSQAVEIPQEIVERLTEATVYIETHVVLAKSDWENLPEKARAAIGKRPGGAASGSGFLISNDGYILTNAHVVDTMRETVEVEPGKRHELRFIPADLKVVVRSGRPGEKVFTPKLIKLNSEADLAL